jgi:hypothetical protein
LLARRGWPRTRRPTTPSSRDALLKIPRYVEDEEDEDDHSIAEGAPNHTAAAAHAEQEVIEMSTTKDRTSPIFTAVRSAGVLNARLREFQLKDSTVSYGLVVYFDGDEDRKAALAALQAVPAPDSTFDGFRKQTQGWPLVRELR